MQEQIKFTEQELVNIKTIQDDNSRLTLEFGQLHMERFALDRRLKELLNLEQELEAKYLNIQTREQVLVRDLNEKYGSGTVDIESGVFIPTK